VPVIVTTAFMSNDRPHVFIPSPPRDTQQRAVPTGPSDYNFQVLPPHPFIGQDMASPSHPPPLPPRRPRTIIPPPRPRIRSVSDYYPTTTTTSMSFPEPHFRATSYQENLSAPAFLQGRSDNASSSNSNNLLMPHTNRSVSSFASSYAEDDNYGLGSAEVCSSVSSLLLISLIQL
jgi:hypothetical protein